MPQITLSDVAKAFGHGKYAVEHLDLELPDGSFTAILGPSGCGKTTTLRMLAGLERPTAGVIRVGERVFSSARDGVFIAPNQRDLGLVFQNYALWPHLTVRENVEFGLAVKKVSRPTRRSRVEEMLELLHVGHLAARIPAQLSGGEQQRVAIARALAPSPALVMFDEPLSNLDAPLRLELSAELKRLHHELAMTALLVTHDQAEAMAVATEVVVMREGRVEQVGSPAEVYGAPASVHVARFIGSPPMNLMAADGVYLELRDLVARRYGIAPGAIAHLGTRPEHVLVAATTPAWGVEGRIQSVMLTGPSAIVRVVLTDGSVLAAVVSAERDLRAGAQAVVSVDPGRVHAFGSDGARLESRPIGPIVIAGPALVAGGGSR